MRKNGVPFPKEKLGPGVQRAREVAAAAKRHTPYEVLDVETGTGTPTGKIVPRLEPSPSKRQSRHADLIRGAEARSVRYGARSIYTGLVPLDPLDGKMMAGEGLIEVHFWVLVPFIFPDIEDAFAQPRRLPITFFGELHHWTPDALIRRRNGVDILAECKPLEKLQPDKQTRPEAGAFVRARRDAMRRTAHDYGCLFMEITEVQVRMEPRWHNANRMARALSSNIPKDAIKASRQVLSRLPAIASVADLACALPEYAPAIVNLACVLDHFGDIRLDRRTFFWRETPFANRLTRDATTEHLS